MNIRTLLLVLALVCLGSSLVMPKKKAQKKFLHGRPKGGFVPKLNVKGPKEHTSPDQFIAMKVNHFDSSSTETYQKRYWYNNQYYKQGGPVFLYINGESEGTSDWITDSSLLVEMAQANNAFLFATEHRYYGSSIIPGQGPSKMQYLSSRQELLDLVDFVPAMNKLFSFPSGQKWVTFGGSYAGGLTALSRAIYPNTFYAGVGSSGVVNALVDYIGYMNVVQDVLNSYNNTQTNLNCGQTVKDAVTAIMPLLNTANGRQQLFKGFQLCQPLDLNNTMLMGNFWASLFDTLMGQVQYGQYRPDCAMLTDTSTGSDALTRFQSYVTQMWGGCIDIDYNDYIAEIKSDGGYYNWIYQTCSEFGWYQSTDGDKNVAFFGNTVPVSWYVPECAALFGTNFGNSSVYSNVVSTNNYYGGASGYNGTRVVLPNGLADPWHVVSVLTATNSQQTLVLIPGGSHCEDMYADSASDTDAMKQAKTTIKSTVASWFSS